MNANDPNRDELRRRMLTHHSRRHFLGSCGVGLGAMWLGQQGLVAPSVASAAESIARDPAHPSAPLAAMLPAKAKHVIHLQMTGAPSQLDLFDYKPDLVKYDGKDCPKEYVEGKRFAFITGYPQLLGPVYPFHRHAKTGQWITDRLPHFEGVLEDVCIVKSLQSEQFNHAPAQLLALTGNQNLGYACMGSWVLYGLGSENENLPGYVVLLSGGQSPDAGKAAWGSGFLPGVYQGIQCRGEGDPVLFLSDPPGVSRQLRGGVIDTVNRLNRRTYEALGDSETATRISQYEMAFRMQVSATDAMDLNQEPKHIHELYGTQPGQENFANNCLLARRLVERGVRFVQLFDWGWDHHSGLDTAFPKKCEDIDRPMAALLIDLKRRGLLDETLLIWGGEFGRTPMQENHGGMKATSPGRDHHIDAFTMWLAGGGVQGGISYGETDEIGFSVASDLVTIRDFHATLLHLAGLDHERLSFPYQGLNQSLTGVRPARVVEEILA